MGRRLRLLALILIVVAVPLPSEADEFVACWVAEVKTPFGNVEQVTRCRIAGGDTVDYGTDSDVPSVLNPNLGTDLTGQCWYLTSASTSYVILNRYADGSADIGLLTDPSDPGSIVAIGPTFPRCTSEPTPLDDPAARAWDYVMAYIHDPPAPSLSPTPGEGVTGLTTFVAIDLPTDHTATLASGLSSLVVEIEVPNVIVDWGDGEIITYPAEPDVLSGYPEGSATHVYEVKDEEGLDLIVEYDWWARWRTPGGPWVVLPVPNTSTTVVYPVAEIVSRLEP